VAWQDHRHGGVFPLFEAVPAWQRSYVDALRAADWPTPITAEDSGVLFAAEHVVAVFVDVMLGGDIAEVVRADYDGDRLWLGEDSGSHELSLLGVKPAGAGLAPAAAAARTFAWFVERAAREMAILVWYDASGAVLHRECLSVQDGRGGWFSDHENQARPPRRAPDRIIRSE
jgi:hypothetical protein